MCFSMLCIFKRHVYFAYSNFPIVSIRERTIVEKMAREEKVWKKTVARDWTVFLGLCSQSTIERHESCKLPFLPFAFCTFSLFLFDEIIHYVESIHRS